MGALFYYTLEFLRIFLAKDFPHKKSQHAQHIQKLSNKERQNQREKRGGEVGKEKQCVGAKAFLAAHFHEFFSLFWKENILVGLRENIQVPPLFIPLISSIKHPLKIFSLYFSILNFPSSLKSFQTNRPKEWTVFSFVIYLRVVCKYLCFIYYLPSLTTHMILILSKGQISTKAIPNYKQFTEQSRQHKLESLGHFRITYRT